MPTDTGTPDCAQQPEGTSTQETFVVPGPSAVTTIWSGPGGAGAQKSDGPEGHPVTGGPRSEERTDAPHSPAVSVEQTWTEKAPSRDPLYPGSVTRPAT